jgi:hypothetical protein
MSSNAFNELDREYTEREDYLANRAEERRRKITFMDALTPQTHTVSNARKVSFWDPVEEIQDTGMTQLQEIEHDLNVFQRRLDKAIAKGICGQQLELIKRKRNYKRRIFTILKKEAKK